MKDKADEVAAKVSREAIPRENGVEEIDKLVAEVSGIQRVATETTVVLPPYDVRRTQEEIQALQKKLQQLRDSFAPKKKFTFKSRSSKSSSSSSKEAEASATETKQADAATPAPETAAPYPANTNVICDKADEVLRVTREQMGTSNDVLIKDCCDSTIFMHVLVCLCESCFLVVVCADRRICLFRADEQPARARIRSSGECVSLHHHPRTCVWRLLPGELHRQHDRSVLPPGACTRGAHRERSPPCAHSLACASPAASDT